MRTKFIEMAAASSSIVLKSLSILLGLFFIFVGLMKIGPYLSKELHRDLVNNRVVLLSFIFFLYRWKKWLMRVVGGRGSGEERDTYYLRKDCAK